MAYSSFRSSRKRGKAFLFRRFGIALIALLMLILAVVSWRQLVYKKPAHTNTPAISASEKTQIPAGQKQQDTIRLIATGDTIAHDAINAAAKTTKGYDYYQFMKPMQPFFDKADIRFCNQAVPGGGTQFGITGYPVFNSPTEVARDMNRLGCNVINTGTNHTFDRGQAVIDAELNYWDTLPNMLAVAGANRSAQEQDKIRFFSVKGVRFAFLSYSTYSNSAPANSFGVNMFERSKAQAQVAAARKDADIVIVSMRWGTEYSAGINNQQSTYSQLLADWGADVVLGHGPHVLEPVKQLTGANGRKTIVWYSIGNFLNAQIPVESLISGIAIMDVSLTTKSVMAPKYLPIYMHYEWTAEEKARSDLLKRTAFTLVPLDSAAGLLARSQNNTTIGAQTERVRTLLNQFTAVTIINSNEY